jgi:hypothetical protein
MAEPTKVKCINKLLLGVIRDWVGREKEGNRLERDWREKEGNRMEL